MRASDILNKLSSFFVKPRQQNDSMGVMVTLSSEAPVSENKKSVTHTIKQHYNYRVDLSIRNWRAAVATAEDNMRPRRAQLYRLYHAALEDDHLLSQIRTAKTTVRMSPFVVQVGKKDNEELTELLEKPWFGDFLNHLCDTEFWGHSLVEFNPTLRDGYEFTKLELIPRLFVRPETREIAMEHAESGLKYMDSKFANFLLEFGDRFDLGLLKVATRTITRKSDAFSDWARRNEKYGMPFLIVRTSSRNKQELDKKEDMAKSFGNNAWAIFDDNDTIELKESNNQMAHQTYKDHIEKADDYISKLINGQSATADEKSFVGSAEVQERILNKYILDRLRRIQDQINTQLFPFLLANGYPLKGAKFVFEDLKKKDKTVMTTPQPPEPPQPPTVKQSVKKKWLDGLNAAISLFYKPGCSHTKLFDTGLDISEILEKAARKVFDRKLKAGEIDQETWQAYSNTLKEAISQNTPEPQSLNDEAFEMRYQFNTNVMVFACFKNHAQVQEMAAALDEGETWEQFRDKANAISEKYNQNWLRTEYNTAIGAATMASKWLDFQQNKTLLPFLQYKTVDDKRVRPEHQKLHNVTKKVDDAFWDTWFPPNGWNCRCDVIQVAGPERDATDLPDFDETPAIFRHNPGKTKELYNSQHPYYKEIPTRQRNNIYRAASTLLYNAYPEEQRRTHDTKTGGWLVNTGGSEQAEATARKMAAAGAQIEIPVQDTQDGANIIVNGNVFHYTETVTIDALKLLAEKNRRLLIVNDNISRSDLAGVKDQFPTVSITVVGADGNTRFTLKGERFDK